MFKVVLGFSDDDDDDDDDENLVITEGDEEDYDEDDYDADSEDIDYPAIYRFFDKHQMKPMQIGAKRSN